MGSKIFVNFTRYDYDECIRRLNGEIQAIFKPIISLDNDENIKFKTAVDKTLNTNQDTNISQNKTTKILKWTEADVEKWFTENNIHPNIEFHLKPCDGQLLYEYYLIQKETPDFFRRTLSTGMSNFKPVLIKDIAVFSLELKKIVAST